MKRQTTELGVTEQNTAGMILSHILWSVCISHPYLGMYSAAGGRRRPSDRVIVIDDERVRTIRHEYDLKRVSRLKDMYKSKRLKHRCM